MSARVSFESEMNTLKADLLEMGSLVEHAIDNVYIAFKNQDHELAKEIMKGDRAVNDIQRSIEARCLSLILRQQPVAKDLRVVSTALKVVTDMERIGDQAADIAEILLSMDGERLLLEEDHILEMTKISKEMVKGAVHAFADVDLEAAKRIRAMDDKMDALFSRVKEEVIQILSKGGPYADNGINLLMIAKYLERVGDHAENICEWIEFYQTGSVNSVRIL